jgi:hypothetical protein
MRVRCPQYGAPGQRAKDDAIASTCASSGLRRRRGSSASATPTPTAQSAAATVNEEHEAGRRDQQADDEHRLGSKPVDEARGQRRGPDDGQAKWQVGDPGLECAVAQHLLGLRNYERANICLWERMFVLELSRDRRVCGQASMRWIAGQWRPVPVARQPRARRRQHLPSPHTVGATLKAEHGQRSKEGRCIMFLKRRLGVLAAVAAALTVSAPVASASAATPGQWIVPSSCAVTNPATGCAPYWAIQGSPASTDRSSEARFPMRFPVLSGRLAGSPSWVTIRGCGRSCGP